MQNVTFKLSIFSKSLGAREMEIINNFKSAKRTEDWNSEHQVIRFTSEDGKSFEYDFLQNKVTG